MSVVLTLAVAATWVTIVILVFGLGAAFLRAFVNVQPTWRNLFLCVISGFALLFQFLTLWHFAFPVNEAALALVAVAAVAALTFQRQWIAAVVRDRPAAVRVWPVVAFMLWTANQALGQAGWDDYNYELQAVRWFHDYPLVPGLANLHGRLGFNNSHHLYAALVSAGPWAGAVNHIVNGLFIVVAVAYCWNAWVDVANGSVKGGSLFAAVLLGPAIGAAIVGSEFGLAMMSTLKADIAVTVLTLLAACLWIELYEDGEGERRRREALAVTIALLLVWLFSIKISAAAFVFILLTALMVTLARDVALRRLLVPIAMLVVVGAAAVLVRGVVLSGYPLYPSTLFGVGVDWRVPEQQAHFERVFINTWGRLRATFEPAGNTDGWFVPWLRFIFLTNRAMLVLPVFVSVSLAMSSANRIRRRERAARSSGWFVLIAACMASLVIWFLEAPDSRFAWSYCWILAAAAIAGVIRTADLKAIASSAIPVITAVAAGSMMFWLFDFSRSQRAAVVLTLGGAALWTVALLVAARLRRHRLTASLVLIMAATPIADRVVSYVLFRRAGDLRTFAWVNARTLRNAPGNSSVPSQTHSGLTVYEASSSDYDTPLPNTPYFNRYLELRQPGQLRWGFRNTGPAAPVGLGYRPRIGGSTPDE